MKSDNLLKRVGALGFPLFDIEKESNAALTLADIVESGDLRFWEGFPVVLANSAEGGDFDYKKIDGYLKKKSDKANLASLVIMSLAVYKYFGLEFSWTDKYCKKLSAAKKREFAVLLRKLKKDGDINVAGREISTVRLKSVFGNYFGRNEARLNKLVQMKNEMSFEYSLSQIFSPKQKELFLKKLRSEKLTKTEKEYYSRAVKKKVLALANVELHNLSQKILL